jgi:biotin carboxylase
MSHILLFGYHPSIGRLLSVPALRPPEQVHLIEEPSLFTPTLPFIRLNQPELGGIVDVRVARYQQHDEYVPVVEKWREGMSFDAVMPGREYGVRASAATAKMLSLPYPGDTAIASCTNKLVLRRLCRDAGIPQPTFSEVRSSDDLRAFIADNGPAVIKPANRHAALGVSKLDAAEDADAAWLHATKDEGPDAVRDRRLRWKYLVETWLDGQQVSVESLVHHRSPIFHNVTWVEMEPGRDFVEAACIVPAPLPLEDRGAIIAAQEGLLLALHAEVGLFHSEWKLTRRGPKLLECAARVPGGLLPEQIWWAWDFNICLAFSQVLQGRAPVPEPPQAANRVCLIRFVYAPAGEVKHIEGLARVSDLPKVVDFKCNLSLGDRVDAKRNPWNYAARFVLVGETVEELQDLRAHIEANLRIKTA